MKKFFAPSIVLFFLILTGCASLPEAPDSWKDGMKTGATLQQKIATTRMLEKDQKDTVEIITDIKNQEYPLVMPEIWTNSEGKTVTVGRPVPREVYEGYSVAPTRVIVGGQVAVDGTFVIEEETGKWVLVPQTGFPSAPKKK